MSPKKDEGILVIKEVKVAKGGANLSYIIKNTSDISPPNVTSLDSELEGKS